MSLLRLFYALMSSFLLSSIARAELQFTTSSIQLKATAQDKTLQASYVFTNRTAHPVWIISLTPSCGCTTASSDKPLYQPGETGLISATYTIGLSQGLHTHTINVRTNESDASFYTLTLTADLPAGQKQLTVTPPPISPRELTWLRQPYTAKTLTIDLRQHPGAKITALCDNPLFQVTIDDTSIPLAAKLTVTPSPETGAGRSELSLRITTPDTAPLLQIIPLTILSRPTKP